ncbi:1-aminocyclopropane-1-carboxylate deaminase/D-cysteine desulfhydrase [Rheinheimera sp. UJ63]|uniref:1-aminocyclopropane-1-carboxylate deaminase/D-cysteine desulfhydrase n=1 Tax=Rheinheimera sp. UJ63 TaxID=2910157 RepID=UPI001F25464F|nr:pyridoxal-phosphate dependent enzyme [Rheinheimera sp. UJ63]MCF4010963.1 pyridoxal-phosphate dependent enzyme [Rheinheimera sp. UJ63]
MTLPSIHWQRWYDKRLGANNNELWLLNLVPPVAEIAGNKWLKLHNALQQRLPTQGILSLGGAFSNHLAALAAAGHYYHFPTIGLVRTEQLDLNNPTLAQCLKHGMQLHALTRTQFRQRSSSEFNLYLQQQYPDYLVIPEGGSNLQGAAGVATLPLADTPHGLADILCCATASGGTLAGLIQRYPHTQILGLAVVKDSALTDKVKRCLPHSMIAAANDQNWSIQPADSNYAKVSNELIDFCCQAKQQQNISIEPVYTGKALQQLFTLLDQGKIPANKRIAFFHTGGLQGLAGLHYRKILSDQQFDLLNR